MSAYLDYFRQPCVEPVKRNKDGMKWIVHRFPIRGGISMRDAFMRDTMKQNVLTLAKDGVLSFRGIPVRIA